MSAQPLDEADVRQRMDPNIIKAVTERLVSSFRQYPSAVKGLLSIVDQAIVSGTAFMTAVIIGRLTSPDQLGLYYLMLSVLLIVSGVQEQLIMSPYAVYSKHRRSSDLAVYAGSVWVHHFVLTMVLAAVLLIAIFFCFIIGISWVVPVLSAMMVAGPLVILRDGIRRFAFANLHLKSVVPMDAVLAVVQIGGLLLLAQFGQLSLVSIFGVIAGACGIACAVWYFIDPPDVAFVRATWRADWTTNWAFGRWALRSFLVGNTTPHVMLWILTAVAGTAAGGVLGACASIVGMCNIVLVGVANVLTPQAAHAFASGGAAALCRVLVRAAAFLALTLGGFCVLVLLSADLLVSLVFGADYQGSGLILLALAANMFMNGLGTVAGNGLWAINQPRLNFFADLCWMAATLIAAVVLVPPLGALGAALAMLAGTSAAAVVRTFILARQIAAHSSQAALAAAPVTSS